MIEGLSLSAENDLGQDGHLGQGIPSQDIGIGNGFCIAELLGLLQGFVIGQSRFHPGQDVVCRSVQYSLDLRNSRSGQAVADEIE